MKSSQPLLNVILDFPINEKTVQRLFFKNPIKIITACDSSESLIALNDIEHEQQNGHYVVGFIAFDEFLTGYNCFFGVYDQICYVDTEINTHQPVNLNQWLLSENIDQYRKKIKLIKNHIKNGDCYQVNYTIRATNKLIEGRAIDLYHHLVDCQAAKYSAFIETETFSILSFSPELFFQQKKQHIETKPMKGTRAIVSEGTLSEQIHELKTSLKDRSENLMIVDLLRNDLSQLAMMGSVKTKQLFEIETYQDVLQMTSTISAELKPEVKFKDIIGSLFPCGSITGAPKKIVSEIINRVEDTPRGPYCGAIGLLTPDNEATFNVAIRTIHHNKTNHQLTYGVGSGITWDSVAEDEYQEIKNKINFLNQDIPISLFETVYLHYGHCLLWEQHFERLTLSAKELGFELPNVSHFDSIQHLYNQVKDICCRGKFIYHKNGIARWELYPLPDTPHTPIVKLAKQPILSTDFRINYKTTDRSVYDNLINEYDHSIFDLILWNERREITEFTRGNLVLELDNELITPNKNCGLLPGILRGSLIKHSIISEAIITFQDLSRAKNIWFINSLRGWVKVTYQS